MKTLFIVSLDFNGGGADFLASDLSAALKQKDGYIQSLKKNNMKGWVRISRTDVTVSDFNEFITDSTPFFDHIGNYKLVEISADAVGIRTKSKADLERQIGRIFANHKDHRLYMKAQMLVHRYNSNMSETSQNTTLHKEYMKVNSRKPEQAQLILSQMHEFHYPVDVYAASGRKEEPETHTYIHVDTGDWVHCTFCDHVMLLPHGSEKCPECGMMGRLKWVDENHPEMSKKQLKRPCFMDRKLQYRSVFSTDTIKTEFPLVWLHMQQGKTVYI